MTPLGELLSRPVGQDRSLSGFGRGVLARSLDEGLPLMNVAPARTRATRCGALTMRQWSCADSMSLNAIARPAAWEPALGDLGPVPYRRSR